MNHHLILFFLLLSKVACAQTDTLFIANQLGFPEYSKLISSDRIYPVIKDQEISYFELLPSDYFHMNYRYDTIKIGLKWKQNQLELNCLNCMYMQLGLIDNSRFYIESGDSHLEFDWQLTKKPERGTGPPLKEKQKLDEDFGYVKLRNRTIFCSKIQEEPPLFLGFIDRNFNGRVDSLDYVSLSESVYFHTAINSGTNLLDHVDTISTDWWNAVFHLLDDKGKFVLLKTKDPVDSPSLLFSTKIPNIRLDSLIDLSTFLKQSPPKYTVVTFWNEYCPDCLIELDSLEKLKSQIQILTFYNRDNLKDELAKGNWTFNTYLSSKMAEESFRLNGMPYYWVLDNQRNCLFKAREWSELKHFLDKTD